MWTPDQRRKFEKAKAASVKWKPAIQKFQELAKFAPRFQDRIEQLALRAENNEALATLALTMDGS